MIRTLSVCAALCALVLAAIALDPDLDLRVAALFYDPTAALPGHFVGDTPLGVIARFTAWWGSFLVFVALAAAALAARFGPLPPRFAPRWPGLLFAGLVLAIGPGLLVHGTLKEISHRPRPYRVAAFGGPDRFRPFTRFDGTCAHNCSFPSGETATALATVAPAMLVPLPWRGAAIAAALVFGAGTGLLRMAFGGHFLSDVLGAAAITLLVILALHAALRRRLQR